MDQVIHAGPGDAGRRLDQVLAEHLNLSRGAARRLLESGAVRLAGRPTRAAAKGRTLQVGDRIEVAGEALATSPLPQPEMPLHLLSQSDGWLILNKPAGCPVHPLRPGETGTVLNAVVARHPEIVGVGEGGLRSGVVHRLDLDTTGCLLLATTQPAWQRLREAFLHRRIDKTYRALVHGRLLGGRDETLHLAVTRHRPAHVRVVTANTAGSRRCTLAWRSLAACEAASLIEVRLGTGFLHQIRAIMAHLGHPLLGDAAYGSTGQPVLGDTPIAPPRPMLHALSLTMPGIAGRAEPPADFHELADRVAAAAS